MTKETQPKSRRPRRMAREPGTPTTPETNDTSAATADLGEAQCAPAPAQKTPSKIDTVLALLRRTEGATLEEMTEATGWQKHTVRASLTGLKKKGHAIVRGKRGEVTCYNVTAAA